MTTAADGLWETCLDHLQTEITEAAMRTWFADVVPIAIENDRVDIAVPSSLARDRIETRYLPLLQRALASAGLPNARITIEVRSPARAAEDARSAPVDDPRPRDLPKRASDEPTLIDDRWADDAEAKDPANQDGQHQSHATGLHEPDVRPDEPPATSVLTAAAPTDGGGFGRAGVGQQDMFDHGLDSNYVFESYVIGVSNRFAQAAALSVAERPARSYNPLFIYGGAGLGKTHLLHAIGHYVRENYPKLSLRYVSTEVFTNEFIEAIRRGTTTSFKRRYRSVDVLLIDDIQFLERKEQTQEEFFHTFNALHGAKKQIVITSDRKPDAIPTLEDRLRSRFMWGLLTDVQPPELETRQAILRKKAEREPVPVSDAVIELIATKLTDNIRELEGALIRVTAFASLNGVPLTVDVAEQALGDMLSGKEPRQITPTVILGETVEMFGFEVDELIGKSRRRPLVMARQISMYVMREVTDLSYPAIAREFGGRDHTTVIHAVDKITTQMSEKRTVFNQVNELVNRVRNG